MLGLKFSANFHLQKYEFVSINCSTDPYLWSCSGLSAKMLALVYNKIYHGVCIHTQQHAAIAYESALCSSHITMPYAFE